MTAGSGTWDGAWQRTTNLRARRRLRWAPLSLVLPTQPRVEDEGLRAVEQHKYRAGPITPLDRILYAVWWEPLARCIPPWLAPNFITLLGAAAAIASGLLLWLSCPSLDGGAPRSVELLAGVLVLFYQTCDALDGLQARRTGACSPLGELLDHGCDGTCLTAFTIGYCVSQQCGLGLLTSSALVVSWLPWWLAQWEAGHTGVVRTGSEYFGITEIEFVVALIHFLTAAVGPDIWKTPVLQLPAAFAVGDGVFDLREVCVCIQLGVALVLSALSILYTVRATADAQAAMVACSRTLPILILGGVTVVWPLLLPGLHEATVLVTVCALFTRIASDIVLVCMTQERYPKPQLALPLLPVMLVLGLLGVLETSLGVCLIQSYAVYCVVDAAAFVVDVVDEIATHLGASLYRVKPRTA